jgi:hypothetical protein
MGADTADPSALPVTRIRRFHYEVNPQADDEMALRTERIYVVRQEMQRDETATPTQRPLGAPLLSDPRACGRCWRLCLERSQGAARAAPRCLQLACPPVPFRSPFSKLGLGAPDPPGNLLGGRANALFLEGNLHPQRTVRMTVELPGISKAPPESSALPARTLHQNAHPHPPIRTPAWPHPNASMPSVLH